MDANAVTMELPGIPKNTNAYLGYESYLLDQNAKGDYSRNV